jgi:tRNA 2-thiouridine synthesizing protein A
MGAMIWRFGAAVANPQSRFDTLQNYIMRFSGGNVNLVRAPESGVRLYGTQGIVMATETLDAKGLNCPMPIMKAKKAMKALSAGDTLAIEATDPGAVKDFEAFCRATGNELVESGEQGGVFHFLLRKN